MVEHRPARFPGVQNARWFDDYHLSLKPASTDSMVVLTLLLFRVCRVYPLPTTLITWGSGEAGRCFRCRALVALSLSRLDMLSLCFVEVLASSAYPGQLPLALSLITLGLLVRCETLT